MHPGQRIHDVRRSRKVTQRQLADFLGVTPSYISHLESGDRNITADLLYKVARFLNVRMAMLMDEVAPSSPFALASRAIPEDLRPDLELCGRLHSNLWELENIVSGRPVVGTLLRLSDLPTAPNKAASEVRAVLGWSSRHVVGISDLVRGLMLHTVSVFGLPLDPAMAGLSTRDAPSCIFINEGLSPQRQLFTLAQQLGHIVLHQRGVTLTERPRRVVQEENEADDFAVQFLMPAELLQDMLWVVPESLDRTAAVRWMAQCLGLDPIAVLLRLDQLGRLSRGSLLDARRALGGAPQKTGKTARPQFDPSRHLPDRYLMLARLAFERREINPSRLADLLLVDTDRAMDLYDRLASYEPAREDSSYYEEVLKR